MAVLVKNPLANAGDIKDMGSVPGLGRPSRGGHGNLFQCSCLENPMDRGAWWATVHRVAESQTRLSDGARVHDQSNHSQGVSQSTSSAHAFRASDTFLSPPLLNMFR